MKQKAIFIGTDEKINSVYGSNTQSALKEKLDFLPVCYTEDILKDGTAHSELKDVEFVFSTWGMAVLTQDEIRSLLPNLKAVFYSAGSVQHFARPFFDCNVRVFSAWAANAVPVAEYTTAQIILANKGFFKVSDIASEEDYRCSSEIFKNFNGNYGAKVGIIGAGMIGKLVIGMLKSYDIDVLVFDPFLPDEKAQELKVKKVGLEELFAECNVVSNHLANNEQTKGMLNRNLFRKMMPYATFLNTGRGAQVVESELAEVLRERKDLTAILDVTMPEPPENGSELYNLKNCILTPHIAGSSGEEVKRMSVYMLEELDRYLNNETPEYEVTVKMLETMA